MIRLASNASCNDCECDIGVKQPNGTEEGEHFCCEAYKRIPDDIAGGKRECKHQKKDDVS